MVSSRQSRSSAGRFVSAGNLSSRNQSVISVPDYNNQRRLHLVGNTLIIKEIEGVRRVPNNCRLTRVATTVRFSAFSTPTAAIASAAHTAGHGGYGSQPSARSPEGDGKAGQCSAPSRAETRYGKAAEAFNRTKGLCGQNQ